MSRAFCRSSTLCSKWALSLIAVSWEIWDNTQEKYSMLETLQIRTNIQTGNNLHIHVYSFLFICAQINLIFTDLGEVQIESWRFMPDLNNKLFTYYYNKRIIYFPPPCTNLFCYKQAMSLGCTFTVLYNKLYGKISYSNLISCALCHRLNPRFWEEIPH